MPLNHYLLGIRYTDEVERNGRIQSNPSTFGIYSGLSLDAGLALHFVPHTMSYAGIYDGRNGVYDQNKKTKPFQPKSGLVYPVSFFIISYLIAVWGWFRLRLCHCTRDFWFGIVGLFVGFCCSIWFGLIVANRAFLSPWEYPLNMEKKFDKGPKAKEKFEHTMTALFKVSKVELAKKIKKKKEKGKD